MKLSLQVPVARGPVDWVQVASDVSEWESAGLDAVWAPEAYGLDAPSLMGFIAGQTTQLLIGSGILSIFSRTPATLAMTAAGIDAVSNGRCILGIGASGPQVVEGWHGVPYSNPLARTGDIIEICRRIWRGEVLEYAGDCIALPMTSAAGTGLGKPLRISAHLVRDRIPIYVAALGPKNVELCASVADGWLPTMYVPELASAVWGDALERGRARRSADLEPLEIVAGGPIAIGGDIQSARDAVRLRLARFVGLMGARKANFYYNVMCRYGYEREAGLIRERALQGDMRTAVALVPDALVDGVSLVGSEGHVRDRVHAFKEAGVSMLDVRPVGPDVTHLIEKVRGWLV